ncbi:unnamed protein product [Tilletia caries]|nr:unnamed protein product [Tilletia caries]
MLYLPAGWYHAVEQVEDIDDSPPEHDGGGRPGICLGNDNIPLHLPPSLSSMFPSTHLVHQTQHKLHTVIHRPESIRRGGAPASRSGNERTEANARDGRVRQVRAQDGFREETAVGVEEF